MKHPSRVTVLALAALSGLGATGLLHRAMASPNPPDAARQPMVVAAAPLSEHELIGPGRLKVVWVRDRPAGAFGRVEELQGRLPAIAVPAGQPVLSSHLAPADAAPGLWNRVPSGQRAITVAINEVAGVAGFLSPDAHVDVIGVSRDGETWRTSLVAQDVPILAIAQDDATRRQATPKVATSATLLVTPEQAAAISLATERGRIRLALRAPNDHRRVAEPRPAPPQAAAPAHKVRTMPPPVRPAAPPAAAPAPQAGIEVIHGETMEVFHP